MGRDVHDKETVSVAQEETGKVVGQGGVPPTVGGFCHLVDCVHAPKGTPARSGPRPERIELGTGVQAIWVSRLRSDPGMEPVVINAREVSLPACPEVTAGA